MNSLKKLSLLLVCSIVLSSCDKDDFTGHSKLKPTSPTITVTVPSAAILNDSDEDMFEIDVTMSVEQIVDVALYFNHEDGEAEYGHDYEITWENPLSGEPLEGERVIIPKGVKNMKVYLTILSEELYYGDVSLTLKIGDTRTANAKVIPVGLTIAR